MEDQLVFCGKCKFRFKAEQELPVPRFGGCLWHCLTHPKTTTDFNSRRATYVQCNIVNRDNDCKDFSPRWWVRLRG